MLFSWKKIMNIFRLMSFAIGLLFFLTSDILAAAPVFRMGESFSHESETSIKGACLKDLDRDGDPDLVMAIEGANSVWINDGLGFFSDTGQQLGNESSFGVALSDINLDTDMDAVFANHGISRVWDNYGGIIIEQPSQDEPWTDTDKKEGVTITFDDPGNGLHFTLEQDVQDGTANACALDDLNTDGYPDIVFANTGANTVWLNDGEGTFSDSLQRLGTSDSRGVSLGDLNGDGYSDAVFSNLGSNMIWLNSGLGIMIDSGQRLGNQNSQCSSLGDLDGDGDTDIVFANQGQDKVWLNNGLGTFSESGQSLGDVFTQSLSIADIDGDGDLDILAANGDPDGPTDQDYPDVLWINDGHGQFTQSDLSLNTNNSVCAFLADLDADGDQDVVVINDWPSENVIWIQVALPDVRTGTVEDNEDSVLSFWALIVSLGDHSASDHGFVWNTKGEPDLNDNVLSLGPTHSEGVFRNSIPDIENDTVYYIKPYVTNDAGTVYGKTVSFDTSETIKSDCFIGAALAP